VFALVSNTTGSGDTANCFAALISNIPGNSNTAIGRGALFSNTADDNTGIGFGALSNSITGTFNTPVGLNALANCTTGGNTVLGAGAGANVTTAGNAICIGVSVEQNVSGSCFIGDIRGFTTANNNAIPVLIDSAGQLGTMSSSRRFKKEINAMDKASEAILALKPVTFHYKSDKTGTPQFGLIVEDVAETNPDLVVRDENGEIYTVRYDAVNAMLLNEFLKEHRKVEEQQKEMDAFKTELKEQRDLIQEVSEQIEMGKTARRVARIDQ